MYTQRIYTRHPRRQLRYIDVEWQNERFIGMKMKLQS